MVEERERQRDAEGQRVAVVSRHDEAVVRVTEPERDVWNGTIARERGVALRGLALGLERLQIRALLQAILRFLRHVDSGGGDQVFFTSAADVALGAQRGAAL